MKNLGRIDLGGNEKVERAYLSRYGSVYTVTLMPPSEAEHFVEYIGYVDIYSTSPYPGTDKNEAYRSIAEDWLADNKLIKYDDDGEIVPLVVANLVREKRGELGLTQQALGEKIGYDGRTAELMIQSIESGRRGVPTAKVKVLAAVLGVEPGDLLA